MSRESTIGLYLLRLREIIGLLATANQPCPVIVKLMASCYCKQIIACFVLLLSPGFQDPPKPPQLNPEPTPVTAKRQAGEIWVRECTKRAWVLTTGEPQGVMGMLRLAVKQARCLLVLVVCARLYFAELSILGIWRWEHFGFWTKILVIEKEMGLRKFRLLRKSLIRARVRMLEVSFCSSPACLRII